MKLDRSCGGRLLLSAGFAVCCVLPVAADIPEKPGTPIEPPAWEPETKPSDVPPVNPPLPLTKFRERSGCFVTTYNINYSTPGMFQWELGETKNVCHPGTTQWIPSRTAAGVYPPEPALPPAPPVGPIITGSVLPAIDLDGDGVPDISSTTATAAGVPSNGCDVVPSTGIQWGGPGDKLVINGMGGGGDGEISAGSLAGPSAINSDSILVASGFKVSENTDVVVQLPCTNFVITRNFTGEKDWPGTDANFNSAGTGWTMSFDSAVAGTLVPVSYGNVNGLRNWEPALRLHETGSSMGGDGFEHMGQPIVVVSPIHDSVMFTNHRWYRSDTGGAPPTLSDERSVREFMPIGPRMQRLEAGFWQVTIDGETVKRPAWILKDPGGGTTVFFRTPVPDETMPWTPTKSAAEAADDVSASASGLADYPDGALWQQIDVGGNQWTFHYQRSWLSAGARGKLTTVVLHGVNVSDESTKAVVDLEYYEGGNTSSVSATGDVVGSGAIRAIKVRRPYDNGSSRSWFYTDLVYYDYFGTLKWFRHNVNIQSRMPSDANPSNDLGGRDDDLVQVTRYTALNQPTYNSADEGNLPLPSTVKWHTAITQYRYTHLGEGEMEAKNRQIKMEFTPGQIEHIARLNLSTLDTDDVLTAWGSAASGRPSARLEATAMALMEMNDGDTLISGGSQPTKSVLNFADRYTAYYTDTGAHYSSYLGRVKTEYTMPGAYGHTRLVNYGYDRLDGCPDLMAFDTLQATEVLVPGAGGSSTPLSYSFGLTGRVQREWEYTVKADAQASSGNPWKLRRLTRHRSEDRVFQEAAIVNGAGAYHSTGDVNVNFLVITTPVTVGTSVQEIADPGVFEDTNTTNDTGFPLGRIWTDRTTFDWSVRGTCTFPMGSVSITQPTSSTTATEAWQIDRLRPEVVSGYATAPGRSASRYLEPTTTSGGLRAAANTPVTSRVAERWAGDPSPSGTSWQVVSRTAYRPSEWFGGAVMSDSARPDLVISNEKFADDAAPGAAPADTLIEKTQKAYTFTSGTGIVTKVVVSAERENTDEFGVSSSSTLDTEYNFLNGVVADVLAADGSKTLYERDKVNGQITKTTLSDNATTPATIVSTALYDLAGRQVLTKSPNGDAAAYVYTLAASPPVKLSTLTGSGATVGSLPLEITGGSFGSTDIPVLCIVQLPRQVASGEWAGPVRIDWQSADQQVLRSSLFAPTASPFSGAAPVASITTLALGDEFSRRMGEYVPSGWTVASHSWGFTPSLATVSGHPEEVYSTSTTSDGDGRTIQSVDAIGNQSVPVYEDALNRVEMSTAGLVGSTPQPVSRTIYDGETSTAGQLRTDGIGPNQVTLSLGLPDGSDFGSGGEMRGTRTWYDRRGRAIATCAVVVTDESGGVITYSTIGPYSVTMYDNLDRPTCTFTVAADATESAMLALANGPVANVLTASTVCNVSRKEYSQRGLVFRESAFVSPLLSPAPPSSMPNRWLVKRHLFDELGREIATAAAGQPVTKTKYDKLGRVTDSYITSEDYTDVSGLRSYSGGTMLEYTQNTYISGTTLVSRVAKTVRSHTDTATPGLGDGHAVTTYADTVYDAAGRATGTINYGTGNVSGGTGLPADVFANATTPPSAISTPQAATGHTAISGIDNTMRAETFYDARGLASKTTTWLTNSLTRTDLRLYDSQGRTYATIENISSTLPTVSWNSSLTPNRWSVSSWSGTSDQNRVTSAVFDAAGNQVVRTAHVRSGSGEGTSQSTGFVYTWGTTGWPSGWAARTKVPLNGRLYETRFPDPSNGVPSSSDIDRVLMAYNGLGEEVATRDQRGVVHELIRDSAGRQVADKVTAFPSGAISSDAPTSVNVATSSGTSTLSLTHAVDDGVKQISTRYDRFGRVSAVYSHSALIDYGVSTGGPTIDDGLRKEPQGSASGQLDASTPPNSILNYVLYQYDRTGDAIRIRQKLDDAAWPNGSTKAAPPTHQLRTYYAYTVPSSSFTFTNSPSTDPNGYEVIRRLDAVRYPGFATADNVTDADGLTPPAHFNGVSMDYGSSGSIEDKIGRVSAVTLRSDWPSSSYSGSEAALKRELVDYKYVGLGTRAITNIADADAYSDRTFGDDRSRSSNPGTNGWFYAGWDRFGRLRLQSWVAAKVDQGTTLRPWFQERLGHDLGGRRFSRDLERGNGESTRFYDDHWRATYDGLSRMTVGERGKVASGTFTAQPLSKAWTLDELGNMSAVTTTGTTSPTTETRGHNATNELSSITSGSTTKNRYYDHSGNLLATTTTTGSTTLLVERMVYDAWNRLVKVERPVPSSQMNTSDPLDRSENRYNGLSWRTVEWRRFAARTGDATLLLARWFTYTGAWQVAQEESWFPVAGWSSGRWSMEQQYYGLRGTDDVVYRRADNAVDSSTPPDGCFASDLPILSGVYPPGYAVDGGYYQLTDSQFSVVAHMDAVSRLISRRYNYDAYGRLESHSLTDFNGDGIGGDGNDDADLTTAISGNDPAGDFNGDGVTDSTDAADYDSAKSLSSSLGVPQQGPQGWGDVNEPRIGYAGYVRAEWTQGTAYAGNTKSGTGATSGGLNWWLARNRFYDPIASRWVNRDPSGYADGLSMYLYVRGNPWGLVDPTGLSPDNDIEAGKESLRTHETKHPGDPVTDWLGKALDVPARAREFKDSVSTVIPEVGMALAADLGVISPQTYANNSKWGRAAYNAQRQEDSIAGSPANTRSPEQNAGHDVLMILADPPAQMVQDAAHGDPTAISRLVVTVGTMAAPIPSPFRGVRSATEGAGVAAAETPATATPKTAPATETPAVATPSQQQYAEITINGERVPGYGPKVPYSRTAAYGNTPTAADRALGTTDHQPPLVQRYYQGDPAANELPGFLQSKVERAASAADRSRLTAPTQDYHAQGGSLKQFSMQMRKYFFGY